MAVPVEFTLDTNNVTAAGRMFEPLPDTPNHFRADVTFLGQ
jgi:hypothetical protein